MQIPFNKYNQFYIEHRDEILKTVDQTISSGSYIRESNVLQLEKSLAQICNRNFAITTSSCTDALFFALKAIGIQQGDEIIIPTYSYIASLEAILRCGAVPVFIDIDKSTLMLDIYALSNAISNKSKAIMLIQLFGNCFKNIDDLKKIAHANNLLIIEDAAQGLGSSYKNHKGGNFGDISCISFDPTKIVSAYGTGGAVLMDNDSWHQTIKKIVNHGLDKDHDCNILGYNSKISAINAAIINLQLENLNQIVSKMNQIAKIYTSKLEKIEQIQIILPDQKINSTFHKYVIIADNRDELKNYLTKKGIETKIHYSKLLSDYKLLKNYKHKVHNIDNAITISKKALSLPIFYTIKDNEIDYICNCIFKFYNS